MKNAPVVHRTRRFVGVGRTLFLALVVLVGAQSAASASVVQDPAPVTTVSVDLGTGTTDPGLATPSKGTPPAVDTAAVKAENRRLVVIVGGLLAVAVALLLMTIRFWRVTRPERPDEFLDDESGGVESVLPRSPEKIDEGRRSRRSIAGADHDGVDDTWEPRATGEQEAVAAPVSLSQARPSRSIRAQVLSPKD